MELKAQRVFMCPLFRHVHSPTWSTTPTRVVCWLQSMNLHGLIITQIPLFTLGLAAGCCINITLPTKVCLVKAMVFPAVMYGCESWTVKKAEHRRIDAFEPWCCRRPKKTLAPHSSTLAWKIPWIEEPGGLQFMGLLRV